MPALKPSIPDTVALCQAVQERFIELCGTYQRIRGVELLVPPSLDADMLRWRQMSVRFKQGDYRNSEEELKSLQEIATWTVSTNAALRNQPPQHIVWREEVGL